MFRDRDITLVVIARFVARMGGEAAFFIGVWGMAAYRFDATPSRIAVLMATLAVTSMVGSAVAGVLVDRYGPRNVLIGAQLVYAPIAIAVPFAPTLDVLIAACALFGLATAPIMTATGSFAPYLAEERAGIERVNATLEGAGALSFVFGPALGALVASVWHLEAVFWVDAALTTLGAMLVLPVRTPPKRSGERAHPLAELAEGLKVTYGLRGVRYYVLMGTLTWFIFGAFSALEPLFYRDVVGVGVEWIGWMNSLFGIAIGIGAWLLVRIPSRFTSARTLALGVAAIGLSTSAYVGTDRLVVIAFGSLLLGGVIGLVEPMLRTLMQLDAPPEYVGRVMGAAHLHRSGGELLPLAVAPTLAAIYGVQAVMIGGGVIAAVVALATFRHAASIDAEGHARRGPLTVAEALPSEDPISPIG